MAKKKSETDTAGDETANTGTALSLVLEKKSNIVIQGVVFKQGRKLIVPQLKMENETTYKIVFLREMEKQADRNVVNRQGISEKKEGPWIALVGDLETGKQYNWIVGAKVRTALENACGVVKRTFHLVEYDVPSPEGYIGRAYLITKGVTRVTSSGRSLADYELEELETDGEVG